MPCYNVLYNPSSGEEYRVKNKTQHHKCDSRHGLRETMAMKLGWVLTRELCSCGQIYLYSPFTQVVVNLPALPAEYLSPHKGKFTFSYCSESRHFRGIRRSINETFSINLTNHVASRTGTVGTLEFGFDNYWSVVVNHEKDNFLRDTRRPDFVVCEEELFVVGSFDDGRREISRLDWSQKSWIKEVSLSKWVVFLGSSISSLALMLPVGENRKDLAGRVYFNEFEFRYDHFYDCHFRLYNDAVNAITPACLPLSSNGSVFRSYPFGYEAPCAFWIEPPNL
ncbi:hypothetical protein TIFTF001_000815 [Ficus carica]|uniref:DUF295 domain-containing protein n=1 Tax=Ficus carica TaxID=3494 RepID=A0AA87ZCJ9_FICCA|nr:hypothetical protein TIFTF001_000815 [Ficus carica]